MCHIVPQPKTFLQYDPSLSPATWRGKSSVQESSEKVQILEKDYISECQTYRGQFKNGIQHHRTRQILSSCLYALSKELIVPFNCDCQTYRVKPRSENYSEWINEKCSEQSMLFYNLANSYLLDFNLYTEATHKNHSIRMIAARVQFAPLFYSFKHPKYQKVPLRKLLEHAQMPELLISFLGSHECFSVSNYYNRVQGSDFIQDESNKLVKLFLPPDMLFWLKSGEVFG